MLIWQLTDDNCVTECRCCERRIFHRVIMLLCLQSATLDCCILLSARQWRWRISRDSWSFTLLTLLSPKQDDWRWWWCVKQYSSSNIFFFLVSVLSLNDFMGACKKQSAATSPHWLKWIPFLSRNAHIARRRKKAHADETSKEYDQNEKL